MIYHAIYSYDQENMDPITDFASMPIIVEKDDEGKEMACRNELEIASFLALVESKRKKGGGLFKKQGETISFVSYVGWPFLFIKKSDSNSHVVFDMLGLFSYTINFAISPDAEGFTELIKSHSDTDDNPDDYIAVLHSHHDVFRDFVDKINHKINGCLEEKKLINDIVERTSISSYENAHNSIYLLPSRLDISQAEESLRRIIKLKESALSDLNQLNFATNTMIGISQEWKSNLTNRQSDIADYYNSEIDKITPDVQEKVNEYKRRMNKEIHSVDMDYSQRMSGLKVKLSKSQRDEDMYRQMGEQHKKKLDLARHQKNTINDQLSQLQTEKNGLIVKAEQHYTHLINEQWQRIRSLEKTRDEQIKELENKKNTISHKTSTMDAKIGILVQKKNESVENIENVGTPIPENISSEFGNSPFIIHIPMLVASLQTDKKKEWLVYPPMTFKKSKGFMDAFKGLVGGLALPLESRTELFDKMLRKRFEESLESDESLGNELLTHCQKHNMLENAEAKTMFSVGIEMIKNMKWLKEKQFQEIKIGIETQFKI